MSDHIGFFDLLTQIWVNVIQFLDAKSIDQLGQCGKQYKIMTSDPFVWKQKLRLDFQVDNSKESLEELHPDFQKFSGHPKLMYRLLVKRRQLECFLTLIKNTFQWTVYDYENEQTIKNYYIAFYSAVSLNRSNFKAAWEFLLSCPYVICMEMKYSLFWICRYCGFRLSSETEPKFPHIMYKIKPIDVTNSYFIPV